MSERALDVSKKDLVLINKRELLSMIPLSEKTIFNKERAGLFPRRFAITTRRVAWDQSEVIAWIEKQKQARAQVSAPGKAKLKMA